MLLPRYWEEGTVALDLLYRTRREWNERTIARFSRLLGEVSNWAHCDELSNHSVGYLSEKFPDVTGRELLKWAGSRNRWARRAAAVSLILPARRGMLLPLAFEISARLLEDEMVQKGVGWLLKECSKTVEREVVFFLAGRRTSLLVLRIASEKMSKNGKDAVLGRIAK